MKQWSRYFVAVVLCILGVWIYAPQVSAAEINYTQIETYEGVEYKESLKENYPTFSVYDYNTGFDKKGKVKLEWYSNYEAKSESSKVTYQLQMADNSKFKKAKTFTTSKENYSISRSKFGKNGGTFYFRVRFYDEGSGSKVYSSWSEVQEWNFVKINKTNFPQLYKIFKADKSYDVNGDGWFDPSEINNLQNLTNVVNKKVIKISNVKGIHFLKQLWNVNIQEYTGTTADLSKNKRVYIVWFQKVKSKSITVNAPSAVDVAAEGASDNKKLNKIDVSKCKKARFLYVFGCKATKTVKLPTYKKNLMHLEVSGLPGKTLNYNAYTNLDALSVYNMDVTKVQINKCKKLRYLYFYVCDKIKKVDVRANKKLVRVDASYCKYLKKSKIKVPSKTELTQDQGKPYLKSKKYAPVYNDLNRIDDNADKMKGRFLEIKSASRTSSGKAKFTWEKVWLPKNELAKVTYQVQMADNPEFKKATTYKTTKTSLTIPKDKLGANGGKFYFRLRAYDSASGEKVYSDWSATEEYSFVKINKTNFPGLHDVLKNGTTKYDVDGNKTTTIFDTNKDGWLDPCEIEVINHLYIEDSFFEEGNIWKEIKGASVSTLKGVEYLNSLQSIRIDNYSGTIADVSDTNVYGLYLRGITASSIQVIAPKVTNMWVEAAYENKNLLSIDLTDCPLLESLCVKGCDATQIVKLPKNKWRLMTLELNNLPLKDVNLSVYRNLKTLKINEVVQ